MRVVFVSEFYSRNVGYTENCLPKALAALGCEVHVVTSQLQVYGHARYYDDVFRDFLGEREQPLGSFEIDGYHVHRLPYKLVNIPFLKRETIFGYIQIQGHAAFIKNLAPDIIQTRIPSDLNTFPMALLSKRTGIPLFTECHQHMSVMRPALREGRAGLAFRAAYGLTRTAPGRQVGQIMRKCYAIAEDCAEVATRFYGFPAEKVEVLSLGTDTDHFSPGNGKAFRVRMGWAPGEVVAVYSGRFTEAKNPLLLAKAIAKLRSMGRPFRALFVGDGPQAEAIQSTPGCETMAYVPYPELPEIYRAADIAVWPRQETMSMLDASACGTPIVVCDTMGQKQRIQGNGLFFREQNEDALAQALLELESPNVREKMGRVGRRLMTDEFSWRRNAAIRMRDYENACLSQS